MAVKKNFFPLYFLPDMSTAIVEQYCNEIPIDEKMSLADTFTTMFRQWKLTSSVEKIVQADVDAIKRRRIVNRVYMLLRIFGVNAELIQQDEDIIVRRKMFEKAYFEDHKDWVLPILATYGLVE